MSTFRERLRRLRTLETQDQASDQADQRFAALLAIGYGDGSTPVRTIRREALAVVRAEYGDDDADAA